MTLANAGLEAGDKEQCHLARAFLSAALGIIHSRRNQGSGFLPFFEDKSIPEALALQEIRAL